MTELKKTAIHEAGHAVAFYRLFGDDGRYGGPLTIEPHGELLGSHRAAELLFPGNEEVTAAEQQAFENEAIYACAGYAAMVAVDYTEKDALASCESDFEAAQRVCNVPLDAIKDKAVALMTLPKNATAVARVAGELLNRSTLEWDEVEILINVADGEATEQEYQRYLVVKSD